jgi:RHS repeat-associated protein
MQGHSQKIRLFLAICCLCAGPSGYVNGGEGGDGLGPEAISLPSGAGSIEGLGESFEPQLNTGSWTYSVGIEIPPGRAGFQPSLGLSYSSNGGNSSVGLGWNLAILKIHRQTDKGFPAYNGDDTFVFNGEELVPLNNSGSVTQRDWRCENEASFQRFRVADADGDFSPDSWTVTDRNGIRHFFGRHRGAEGRWSVIEHPSLGGDRGKSLHDRAYCWALDESVDLHGNRIEYEYEQGQGTLFVSRVTYGHHNGNYHEVRFIYEERPDVLVDYRPTFPVVEDRRLARIEVRTFHGNQSRLVRWYALAYHRNQVGNSELDLGPSVLARVTQHSRSGRSEDFLPPLRLEYTDVVFDATNLMKIEPAPKISLAQGAGRSKLIDLNGDSLPDLVRTRQVGGVNVEEVSLNLGETLGQNGERLLRFEDLKVVANPTAVDLGGANSVLMDCDDDGLVDYLEIREGPFGSSDFRLHRNRGRLFQVADASLGFEPASALRTNVPFETARGVLQNPAIRRMDLNFDKQVDFLSIRSGTSFGIPEIRGLFLDRAGNWDEQRFDTPEGLPNDLVFARDDASNAEVRLADLNGDRMQDLVWVRKSGSGAVANLRVSYWAYRGFGDWAERREMSFATEHPLQINSGDLNDVFVEDITGDGLADLLFMSGGGRASTARLFVNLVGERWATPHEIRGLPAYEPRDSFQPTSFRLVDLNGNGSTDLLWENTGIGGGWHWIDLMPGGKPNLLRRIDNSLGKITRIDYGSAVEDLVRSREEGSPWTTHTPLPIQVVRRVRVTGGYDLDGLRDESRELSTDQYVSEFKYRDAYYDAAEREFRGFAFAERVDYGDDFVFDHATNLMRRSDGWEPSKTPTGQVSGPTLVTRYHYHTGAPDGVDNDELGARLIVDEFTEKGGGEEEPLKGRPLMVETIDPRVLHDGQSDNNFDQSSHRYAMTDPSTREQRMTDDRFVYRRTKNTWRIRRLYRNSEEISFAANNNDGERRPQQSAVLLPRGRFSTQNPPVEVQSGIGKTVSFVYLESEQIEVIEANGLLSDHLVEVADGETVVEFPSRESITLEKAFDFDDYGNLIRETNLGIAGDSGPDDERVKITQYAHEGTALSKWVINLPSLVRTEDEDGRFVSESRYYYDGAPFVGLSLGHLGDRALVHREQAIVHGGQEVAPIELQSTVPGDPRLSAGYAIDSNRSGYDDFGNVIAMMDPLGGVRSGHLRQIGYDPFFATYPTEETIVIGDGSPDLVLRAEYDYGFGVVTRSEDFNGNVTSYDYDAFARPVSVLRPLDTADAPTAAYEYEMVDPSRAQRYRYDAQGTLTIENGDRRDTSRVITRLREKAGEPGVFTSVTYVDGFGETLAEAHEGEDAGDWIVPKAQSYNRRRQVSSVWMPYDVAVAQTSDQDPPRFASLWPEARPVESDLLGRPTVAADTLLDPTGRKIGTIHAPESYEDLSRRARALVRILPLETWIYDENDSQAGSVYVNTPHVQKHDGLGRLIEVHERTRMTDEGVRERDKDVRAWITRYQYDLNDKLTRIIDSQNNHKWMRYDGLGRVIFMHDPNRGKMFFTYDNASNLVATRDAKEQVIRYTFDGANRRKTEDYLDEDHPYSLQFNYDSQKPISPENRPDVAFFYDRGVVDLDMGDTTSETATNTKGVLAYVWDQSGEEHFSYDARGRMTWRVKRVFDPELEVLVGFPIRQSYDSLDRVTRLTYPDLDYVDYVYNSRNLLESIVGGPSGAIIQSIDYQPSAQERMSVYGNGVRTKRGYDPRLRMTRIQTAPQENSAASWIDYRYRFDRASNIDQILDRRPLSVVDAGDPMRNTQVFQHDDLYRLTQVSYSFSLNPSIPASDGTIKYRYDRLGNMRLKSSDLQGAKAETLGIDSGSMNYGGSSGAKDRMGREGGDPGPHALSQYGDAKDPVEVVYDANGNTVASGNLRMTWDFKDRLIRVESEGYVARYTYDHSDTRVTKSLKVVGESRSGISRETSVLYPDRSFEIREYGAPIKFVWNGNTRVARVAGNANGLERIQRVRLHSGWNQVVVLVRDVPTLDFERMIDSPDKLISYSGGRYLTLSESVGFRRGDVIWMYSPKPAIATLRGVYGGDDLPGDPSANSWWLNSSFESVSFSMASGGGGAIWSFVSDLQDWNVFQGSGFEAARKFSIGPGTAAYFSGESNNLWHISDVGDSAASYYFGNHLGSVELVLSSVGGLIWRSNYLPYGEFRNVSGSDHYYGFSQKERDVESALHYFEARYFNSFTGRFVSVDPLASEVLVGYLNNPQRVNAYSYSGNMPIGAVDPSGQSWEDVGGDVGEMGAGLVMAGVSLIPGPTGDVVDAAILANPNSDALDRGVAGASLAIGAMTGSALPNLGGVFKGVRSAFRSGKRAVTSALDALKRSFAKAPKKTPGRPHSQERRDLIEMAKSDKMKGATREDMKAYQELNDELPDPIPANKVRVDEGHPNRGPHAQVPHGHVDNVDYIPITDP